MSIPQKAYIYGSVLIVLKNANNVVKYKKRIRNLITNNGIAYALGRTLDPSIPIMSHMGLGSNLAPTEPHHNVLGVPLGSRVALSGINQNIAPDTLRINCNFGPGQGTGPIGEIGLFNSPTSGWMIARIALPSLINKEAGDSLRVQWTIQLIADESESDIVISDSGSGTVIDYRVPVTYSNNRILTAQSGFAGGTTTGANAITIGGWFKPIDSSGMRIFGFADLDGLNTKVLFEKVATTNVIRLSLGAVTSTDCGIYELPSNKVLVPGENHHVMMSINIQGNAATASFDGVNVPVTIVQSPTIGTFGNSNRYRQIGNVGISAGTSYKGEMSQFFVHDAYVNLEDPTARIKFINDEPKSVDYGYNGSLPFGSEPLIYINDRAILINRGDLNSKARLGNIYVDNTPGSVYVISGPGVTDPITDISPQVYNRAICIGDSITAGGTGYDGYYKFINGSVARNIARVQQFSFSGTWLNNNHSFSISENFATVATGTQSSGNAQEPNNQYYNTVIVTGGVNDIAGSPTMANGATRHKSEWNLIRGALKILAKCQTSNKRAIFINGTPAYLEYDVFTRDEQAGIQYRYNTWLNDNKNKLGFKVVNAYSLLSDNTGQTGLGLCNDSLANEYNFDGLHPNNTGMQLIASEVENQLSSPDLGVSLCGVITFDKAIYAGLENRTIKIKVKREFGSIGVIAVDYRINTLQNISGSITGTVTWGFGDTSDKEILITVSNINSNDTIRSIGNIVLSNVRRTDTISFYQPILGQISDSWIEVEKSVIFDGSFSYVTQGVKDSNLLFDGILPRVNIIDKSVTQEFNYYGDGIGSTYFKNRVQEIYEPGFADDYPEFKSNKPFVFDYSSVRPRNGSILNGLIHWDYDYYPATALSYRADVVKNVREQITESNITSANYPRIGFVGFPYHNGDANPIEPATAFFVQPGYKVSTTNQGIFSGTVGTRIINTIGVTPTIAPDLTKLVPGTIIKLVSHTAISGNLTAPVVMDSITAVVGENDVYQIESIQSDSQITVTTNLTQTYSEVYIYTREPVVTTGQLTNTTPISGQINSQYAIDRETSFIPLMGRSKPIDSFIFPVGNTKKRYDNVIDDYYIDCRVTETDITHVDWATNASPWHLKINQRLELLKNVYGYENPKGLIQTCHRKAGAAGSDIYFLTPVQLRSTIQYLNSLGIQAVYTADAGLPKITDDIKSVLQNPNALIPGTVYVSGLTNISFPEQSGRAWTLRRENGSEGGIEITWQITGALADIMTGTVTWASGDTNDKAVNVIYGDIESTTAGSFEIISSRALSPDGIAPFIGKSVILSRDASGVNLGSPITYTSQTRLSKIDYTVTAAGSAGTLTMTVDTTVGTVGDSITFTATRSNGTTGNVSIIGFFSTGNVISGSTITLTFNDTETGSKSETRTLIGAGSGVLALATTGGATLGTPSGSISIISNAVPVVPTDYTLANIRTLHPELATGGTAFTYADPAQPVISVADVNVTPETFVSATATNGRRYILGPGDYGDVDNIVEITGTDKEFVMGPGVNVGNIYFTGTVNRIKLTANPPRSGSCGYIMLKGYTESGSPTTLTTFQNVTIDGVNQRHNNASYNESTYWPHGTLYRNWFEGTNLAWINSNIEAQDFAIVAYKGSNITIANNNILSSWYGYFNNAYNVSQAAIRLCGINKLVFVNNRVIKLPEWTTTPVDWDMHKHVLRIHSTNLYPSNFTYIAKNQFEGPGNWITPSGDNLPALSMDNVHYKNNVHYSDFSGLALLNITGDPNAGNIYPITMYVENNQAYIPAVMSGYPTARSGYTMVNNSRALSVGRSNIPNWSHTDNWKRIESDPYPSYSKGIVNIIGTYTNLYENNVVTLQAERVNGSDTDASVTYRIGSSLTSPSIGTFRWKAGESGIKSIQLVCSLVDVTTTSSFTISEAVGCSLGSVTSVPFTVNNGTATIPGLPTGTYNLQTAFTRNPEIDPASGTKVFTFNRPWLPSENGGTALTNIVNVSSVSELTAALNVPGSIITINPKSGGGSYGEITINRNDQRIIITANTIIDNISINHPAARIHIYGEQARVGQVGYIKIGSLTDNQGSNPTDITLEGINQRANATGWNLGGSPITYDHSNVFNGARIAVINSYMEAYRFVVRADGTATSQCQDHIFANNTLWDRNEAVTGTGYLEAAIKYTGGRRIIFVDNNIKNTTSTPIQNTIRFHAGRNYYDAQDLYIRKNQIEGVGQMIKRNESSTVYADTGYITKAWYKDNTTFVLGPQGINIGWTDSSVNTWATYMQITGNTTYGIDPLVNVSELPTGTSPATGLAYAWEVSSNTATAGTWPTVPSWTWDTWNTTTAPPPVVGAYTTANVLAGGIPFGITEPTAPSTANGAVTATTGTIGTYLTGNQERVVTLTAGNYGNIIISGSNITLVLQPNVIIGELQIAPTASRIKITANPVRSGTIAYFRISDGGLSTTQCAQDIIIDGITQSYSGTGIYGGGASNTMTAQRFVILNSSFIQRDFCFVSYSNPGAARLQDLIVGNCSFVDGGTPLGGSGDGQANIRLVGAQRVVFADCRIVGNTTDNYQNFRIHGQNSGAGFDANNFYLTRNQFEGTGNSFQRAGDTATPQATCVINNVWFVNNVQYVSNQPPINVGTTTGYYPTTLIITGNTLYTSTGNYPSIPSGYDWTISNNPTSAWTTPPAWTFDSSSYTPPPVQASDYTLATIPTRHTLPFAVNFPTSPSITLADQIVDINNIGTYRGTAGNGRRLLLQPGDYQDVLFTGQDQEIILQPGVNIRFLRVAGTARRLRFTANPLRSGSIGAIQVSDQEMGNDALVNAEDIIFDGISQNHYPQPGVTYLRSRNECIATRLAFINCSIRTRDACFVSFSQNSTRRLIDCVLANNDMQTNISLHPITSTTPNSFAFRIQGALRVLVVDNRLAMPEALTQNRQLMRFHSSSNTLGTQNIFVSRNQFEGQDNVLQSQWTAPTPDDDTTINIPMTDITYTFNKHWIYHASGMPPVNFGNDTNYWPVVYTETDNWFKGPSNENSTPVGRTWTRARNTWVSGQAIPSEVTAWTFDTWKGSAPVTPVLVPGTISFTTSPTPIVVNTSSTFTVTAVRSGGDDGIASVTLTLPSGFSPTTHTFTWTDNSLGSQQRTFTAGSVAGSYNITLSNGPSNTAAFVSTPIPITVNAVVVTPTPSNDEMELTDIDVVYPNIDAKFFPASGVHWALPTLPTVTQDITVTTQAQLNSALSVNGARIIVFPLVSSGTYTDLRPYGQDQEIVLKAGVRIASIECTGAARRIRIKAETPRDMICGRISTSPEGVSNGPAPTDIVFDGLKGEWASGNVWLRGIRCGYINCQFKITSGWGLGSSYPPNDGTNNYNTNCFFINSEMQCTNGNASTGGGINPGTMRFYVSRNLVVLNSRIFNPNTLSPNAVGSDANTQLSIRIGTNQHAILFAKNQIGTGQPFSLESGGSTHRDIWIENNNFVYNNQNFGALIQTHNPTADPDWSTSGRITNIRITNNTGTGYQLQWPTSNNGTHGSWTVSGNTLTRNDTQTLTMPYWDFATWLETAPTGAGQNRYTLSTMMENHPTISTKFGSRTSATFALPTLPTTTSTIQVTSNAALPGALAVAGARIEIFPLAGGATYTNTLAVTSTDQEIIIKPGVKLTSININNSARRVRVYAEELRNMTCGLSNLGSEAGALAPEDIILDGVNIEWAGESPTFWFRGQRCAIINSRIYGSGHFTFYSGDGVATNGNKNQNMIIANTEICNTGAYNEPRINGTTDTNSGAVRLYNQHNLVIVDSKLWNNHPTNTQSGLRIMPGSQNVYVNNCYIADQISIEPRTGSGAIGEGVDWVWIEYCKLVCNTQIRSAYLNTHFTTAEDMYANTYLHINNNEAWGRGPNWTTYGDVGPTWVVENNNVGHPDDSGNATWPVPWTWQGSTGTESVPPVSDPSIPPVSDSDSVPVSIPPVVSGAYTLDVMETRHTLPFSYNRPIAPNITNQTVIDITTDAGLSGLSNYSGRNIVIHKKVDNTPYPSGLWVGMTDANITIKAGVVITGTIQIGPASRRIRIVAEEVRNNTIGGLNFQENTPYPEDIYIDGLNIVYTGEWNRSFTGKRVAIINSKVISSHINGNSVLSSPGTNGANEDVIIANCDFRSTGSSTQTNTPFFYSGINRFILVDSQLYVVSGRNTEAFFLYNSGTTTPGMTDVYIAKNKFGNVNGPRVYANRYGGTSTIEMNRINILDNEFYTVGTQDGGFIKVGTPSNGTADLLQGLNVQGNSFYGSATSVTSNAYVRALWTIGTGQIKGANTGYNPDLWAFQGGAVAPPPPPVVVPGTISITGTYLNNLEGSVVTLRASRLGGTDETVSCRWDISGTPSLALATTNSLPYGTFTWGPGDATEKTATVQCSFVDADRTGTYSLSQFNPTASQGATTSVTFSVNDTYVPPPPVTTDDYTLDTVKAINSIPFNINLPAQPTISGADIQVTTANWDSTIASTLSTYDNKRFVLAPGDYSDRTINGNNRIVVLTTGVSIRQLNVAPSARIIKITASPVRSGTIGFLHTGPVSGGPGAQDVTIDGITIYRQLYPSDSIFQWRDRLNIPNGIRTAWINCKITGRGVIFQHYGTSTHRTTDLIIANCDITDDYRLASDPWENTLSYYTSRITSANRIAFVNNFVRHIHDPSNAFHTLRFHAGTDSNAEDIFVGSNLFHGPGHMFTRTGDGAASTFNIYRYYYTKNVQYNDWSPGNQRPINHGEDDITGIANPASGSITQNTLYSPQDFTFGTTGTITGAGTNTWTNRTPPFTTVPTWDFNYWKGGVAPSTSYTAAVALTRAEYSKYSSLQAPVAATLPTITSTLDPAPTGTNFNVNGRRYILGAGTYGNVTITGQDIELVLTTGTDIHNLIINQTARRIRITANPIRSGVISGSLQVSNSELGNTLSCEDITFDGITQIADDYLWNDVDNKVIAVRLTMINCSITSRGYLLKNFASATQPGTDWIIANNFFNDIGYDGANIASCTNVYGSNGVDPGATMRLTGMRKVLIIDNRIQGDDSEYTANYALWRHNLRIHSSNNGYGAQDFLVKRNSFTRRSHFFSKAGDGNLTVGDFLRIYYVENTLYHQDYPSSQPAITWGSWQNSPETLYPTNNQLFIQDNTVIGGQNFENPPSVNNVAFNYSYARNTHQTAYTTPPAWSFDTWSGTTTTPPVLDYGSVSFTISDNDVTEGEVISVVGTRTGGTDGIASAIITPSAGSMTTANATFIWSAGTSGSITRTFTAQNSGTHQFVPTAGSGNLASIQTAPIPFNIQEPVAPSTEYTVAKAFERYPSIPFTIQQAAPPVITSTVNVTSGTMPSNPVAGTKYILGAGTYGQIRIQSNDVEIQMGTGVNVASFRIDAPTSRVKLTSVPPRAGTVDYIAIGGELGEAPYDIIIDGINQVYNISNPDINYKGYNNIKANRLTIINSSFFQNAFSMVAFSQSTTDRLRDALIANNAFMGGNYYLNPVGDSQANVRTQAGAKVIWVDNYFRIHKDGVKQNFRIHANPPGGTATEWTAEDYYVCGNQFDNNGHAMQIWAGSPGTIRRVTYSNNLQYNDWGPSANQNAINYLDSFAAPYNHIRTNNYLVGQQNYNTAASFGRTDWTTSPAGTYVYAAGGTTVPPTWTFDTWRRWAVSGTGTGNPPTTSEVAPVIGTVSLTGTHVYNEGQSATIRASRSVGTDREVSVRWTVQNGLTNPDTGIFTWYAGETGERNITVLCNPVDTNQTATVDLTEESGGLTIGTRSLSFQVNNVSAPGTINIYPSVTNAAIQVGQSFDLIFERVGGTDGIASVSCLAGSSAHLSNTSSAFTITWANGESQQQRRTFTGIAPGSNFIYYAAGAGNTASRTITSTAYTVTASSTFGGNISLGSETYAGVKSGDTISIKVHRSNGSYGTSTVAWSTGGLTTPPSGVVTWTDGQLGEKEITGLVVNTVPAGTNVQGNITLSSPVNCVLSTEFERAIKPVQFNSIPVAANNISIEGVYTDVPESALVTITAKRWGDTTAAVQCSYTISVSGYTVTADPTTTIQPKNNSIFSFPAGSSVATVQVRTPEVSANVTGTITLNNPTAGVSFGIASATFRILNSGRINLVLGSSTIPEKTTQQITVQRIGGSTGIAKAEFTMPGMTPSFKELVWADGDSTDKTIDVTANYIYQSESPTRRWCYIVNTKGIGNIHTVGTALIKGYKDVTWVNSVKPTTKIQVLDASNTTAAIGNISEASSGASGYVLGSNTLRTILMKWIFPEDMYLANIPVSQKYNPDCTEPGYDMPTRIRALGAQLQAAGVLYVALDCEWITNNPLGTEATLKWAYGSTDENIVRQCANLFVRLMYHIRQGGYTGKVTFYDGVSGFFNQMGWTTSPGINLGDAENTYGSLYSKVWGEEYAVSFKRYLWMKPAYDAADLIAPSIYATAHMAYNDYNQGSWQTVSGQHRSELVNVADRTANPEVNFRPSYWALSREDQWFMDEINVRQTDYAIKEVAGTKEVIWYLTNQLDAREIGFLPPYALHEQLKQIEQYQRKAAIWSHIESNPTWPYSDIVQVEAYNGNLPGGYINFHVYPAIDGTPIGWRYLPPNTTVRVTAERIGGSSGVARVNYTFPTGSLASGQSLTGFVEWQNNQSAPITFNIITGSNYVDSNLILSLATQNQTAVLSRTSIKLIVRGSNTPPPVPTSDRFTIYGTTNSFDNLYPDVTTKFSATPGSTAFAKPNQPVTTQTINVTTDNSTVGTGLAWALGQSGAIINVFPLAGGLSYATLNPYSNNQLINLMTGVKIGSIAVQGTASRITLYAETIHDMTLGRLSLAPETGNKPSDIVADGLYAAWGGDSCYIGGRRMALLNCRLDQSGHFTVSSWNQMQDGNGNYQNTIIANCEIKSNTPYAAAVYANGGTYQHTGAMRIYRQENLVIVNSRIHNTHPTCIQSALRLTHPTLNAFIKNNQFGIYAPNTFETNGDTNRYIWIENNVLRNNVAQESGAWDTHDAGIGGSTITTTLASITNLTMINNDCAGNFSSLTSGNQTGGTWVTTPNTLNPGTPVTLPAWSFSSWKGSTAPTNLYGTLYFVKPTNAIQVNQSYTITATRSGGTQPVRLGIQCDAWTAPAYREVSWGLNDTTNKTINVTATATAGTYLVYLLPYDGATLGTPNASESITINAAPTPPPSGEYSFADLNGPTGSHVIPFTVTQPYAPGTNGGTALGTQTTISSVSQLTTALGSNGANLLVTPGIYPDIDLTNRTDIRITLQEGAFIGRITLNNTRRVEILGITSLTRSGEIKSFIQAGTISSDIRIRGVRIYHESPLFRGQCSAVTTSEGYAGNWNYRNRFHVNRLMITSCEFAMTFSAVETLANSSDIIIANNLINTTKKDNGSGGNFDAASGTITFTGTSRTVVVDNNISNGLMRPWAVHADGVSNDDHWFYRNQVERNTTLLVTSSSSLGANNGVINRVYIGENDLYTSAFDTSYNIVQCGTQMGSGLSGQELFPSPGTITVTNNRAYGGNYIFTANVASRFTSTGNTTPTWNWLTEKPPVWNYRKEATFVPYSTTTAQAAFPTGIAAVKPTPPALPSITQTIAVNPSNWASVRSTNNARFIFAPGSYGDITVIGSNQELVFGHGVIGRELGIHYSARRIRCVSIPARACQFRTINVGGPVGGWGIDTPEDITLDGIYSRQIKTNNDNVDTLGDQMMFMASRLAIVNCHWITRGWSLVAWGNWLAGGSDGDCFDYTIGNSNLEDIGYRYDGINLKEYASPIKNANSRLDPSNNGTSEAGSGWRTEGCFRIFMTESRQYTNAFDGRFGIRIHAGATDYVFHKNIFEGCGSSHQIMGTGQSPTEYYGLRMYWINNKQYVSGYFLRADSTTFDTDDSYTIPVTNITTTSITNGQPPFNFAGGTTLDNFPRPGEWHIYNNELWCQTNYPTSNQFVGANWDIHDNVWHQMASNHYTPRLEQFDAPRFRFKRS